MQISSCLHTKLQPGGGGTGVVVVVVVVVVVACGLNTQRLVEVSQILFPLHTSGSHTHDALLGKQHFNKVPCTSNGAFFTHPPRCLRSTHFLNLEQEIASQPGLGLLSLTHRPRRHLKPNLQLEQPPQKPNQLGTVYSIGS